MKTEHSVAVQVRDLLKRYPDVTAVDGVSFEVYTGEIFGMVGPNGAGKTTTIECIEGLRQPDTGSIQVLGLDPRQDGYELRERIGIQFQAAALPPRLRVREALDLFTSFYQHSVDWRPLAEQMGLDGKLRSSFTTLSGGQKQRLFIALALVNDPELVFLDELTTGLDPQARRAMWDMVRGVREKGKTVFLTTHFMEEAELLCDRVAILDHGKIIALDTPQNLIVSLKAENRVVFNMDENLDLDLLSDVTGVVRVEQIDDRVVVYGQGEKLLSGVINKLEHNQVSFSNLRTEQPSLEDVFLALTGREMRD